MKNLIVILSFLLLSVASTFATDSLKVAEIKTSAVCDDCKDRIEGHLDTLTGIKSANLDLDKNIITVEFDEKLISLDNIKNSIVEIGYDADDFKRSKKAFMKLPRCCRSDEKH